MAHPNLELLLQAATVLQPILDQFVFVGGCATSLLVTDPGATSIRTTVDVDTIVEITTYAAYADFSEQLRNLGLREDTEESAPICRWKRDQLRIDVMPLDEQILGFSNRWYREALLTAEVMQISPDQTIRLITAPHFLATKLEAFRERGQGDYLGSHDLEDFITVVDGRNSLIAEVAGASKDVRLFIAEQLLVMLAERRFIDSLPGHLPPDEASQERLTIVIERLKHLAGGRYDPIVE